MWGEKSYQKQINLLLLPNSSVLTYPMVRKIMSSLPKSHPHRSLQASNILPDMAEGTWQTSLRLKNLRGVLCCSYGPSLIV